MNHQINRLIHFGLQHHLITEDDEIYAVNLLLDLFHLDSFTKEEINEELSVATDILEEMLNYATQKGLIEDNITERDLFDTRIMNCLMPRPSEVIQTFKKYYQEDEKRQRHIFMIYRLHQIIFEKQERIKIFVLNNFINMEILKLQSIYQNQKKIQRKS